MTLWAQRRLLSNPFARILKRFADFGVLFAVFGAFSAFSCRFSAITSQSGFNILIAA
jgi:hypothetical protein